MSRKLVVGAAIAAGSILLGFSLSRLPLFKTFEWKIYDLQFRQVRDSPDRTDPRIVLVKIDDESIRNMAGSGFGRFPWARDTYRVLLDYFGRSRPKAVAFDLLFLEADRGTVVDKSGVADKTGVDSDRELIDGTRQLGTVVHAIEVNDIADSVPDASLLAGQPSFPLGTDIEEHRSITFPFTELARASRALGHTFVVLDGDGPVRRWVPFVRQGKASYPSLAVATAMMALDLHASDVRMEAGGLRLGSRFIPLFAVEQTYVETIRTRHMLIPYKASAYAVDRIQPSYRSYSFWDLFYSELQVREGGKPNVDPAEFRDKIVLVGTTAAGLHDIFQTPYGDSGKMPGMQIQASVVDGILNNEFIRPAGFVTGAVVPILSITVVALAGVFAGFWWSLLAVSAVLVADAGVTAWSLRQGVWIQSVPAALGLISAQFSSVAYKYFVEDRAKRRIHSLFSRYVPPAVVHELMNDPSKARLGGQRREMTVLFSDIRGFTTLSEANRPEDVIAQLNEYFTRMVEILFQHQGTLDKFVGDMIMALFNAPLEDVDHADHAVQMALAMLKELERLNRKWAAEGKLQFDIGIGINTGEMIVGNVGSEKTLSYTVIGDNVNLGSRLESLNKEYNTHIIISDATRRNLKGSYNIKALGAVRVKGKTREVEIYEVCR
jgi:adenylate cyclase